MRRISLSTTVFLGLWSWSSAHAGLTFDFSDGPGLAALDLVDAPKAASIRAGAAAAAGRWSGLFADDVTLKIALDWDGSSGAPLGVSHATFDPAGTAYGAVTGAMMGDATTPYDASATSHLQPGTSLKFLRNSTTLPGFPAVVDDDGTINNGFMDLTSSNKKALGMVPGHGGGAGSDGTITFGAAPWDFDPSDGIDGGKYDFVAVALHEMSHNMGFISGVDTMSVLFAGAPFAISDPNPAVMVTTLDLFRYTTTSMAAGVNVPDVSLHTPGSDPIRRFSIDGGTSIIDTFTWGTGLAGDGFGASHWTPSIDMDLMQPTLGLGEELTDWFDDHFASPTSDKIALDVIGWTPVPAPGTLAIVGLVGLSAAARRRR